jgi:hypothetical protein
MPVKKLINQPIELILLSAEIEVLEKNDYNTLNKYARTRDLSLLDFSKLTEQPTIFSVMPLLPEYEYMLGSCLGGDFHSLRHLVRHHIVAATQAPEFIWETHKGRKILSEDSCNEFLSIENINELFQVVQEGSTRGQIIPFSSRVQWQDLKVALSAKRNW